MRSAHEGSGVARTTEMRTHSTRPLPVVDLIFGQTSAMRELKRRVNRVAQIDVPVLIQGETGTGKDLLARFLHAHSSRANKPLLRVSCPAIPGPLLESELFGYERGAFTGAHAPKQGRLEQAHNGTLVLDEVGSLDGLVQSKLLQVLQDGSFMRIGGSETRTISTRVISIASEDLRGKVQDGLFRLDLLYRINAVTLELPPLRERIADLPIFIDHFLAEHSRSFGVSPAPLSKGILAMMRAYDWPGNLRELDNMMRSYALLDDESEIVAALTPGTDRMRHIVSDIDITTPCSLKQITKTATQELERQVILKVLHANGWNRRKTAKWLRISYRSLFYKLCQYNLQGDMAQQDEPADEPVPVKKYDEGVSMLRPQLSGLEFQTTE